MVINQSELLLRSPILGMEPEKIREHGVSHGLGEAGYDIRIKQEVHFYRGRGGYCGDQRTMGRFLLASAIEEFDMPNDLVGIVHDKSTWARKGLSVFNTVSEPGFRGGLTLELVYHGQTDLIIPAGAGIAQVIFHQLSQEASYSGKYQDQSSDPEPSRFE